MTYNFICSKCGNSVDIIMPINEYTAEGHICDKCGEALIRNPDTFCKSYIAKCDGFFGKNKK